VALARTCRFALTAAALTACCALTACGGGGSSSATGASGTSVDTTTVATTAPNALANGTDSRVSSMSLAGTPATTATTGAAYSFTPELAGAATAVTYTVSNLPGWATFNSQTGAVSGTPTEADIGTFNAVTIIASTNAASAALPAFSITVAQAAKTGTASLSWTPPTEHTDGSAFTNLGGYTIYFGSSADAMDNKIQITNPGLTAYTIGGLGAGTHFFGISAYSTSGFESDLSIVGSKTIM
jgi:hypothetical protein